MLCPKQKKTGNDRCSSTTFKKNSTLEHQIRGCGVAWFILAGLGPADPGSKAWEYAEHPGSPILQWQKK